VTAGGDAVPGTLVVVTFGDVRPAWLHAIARAAAPLHLSLKAGPALSEPKYAFNPERKAFHGAGIFRKLLQAQPAPERRHVGRPARSSSSRPTPTGCSPTTIATSPWRCSASRS
jgi:hypothetical protein